MNHLNIVDMGNALEDLRKERDESIAESERLTALNKKLTEDFNTLALDRAQWQIRAEEKDHQLAAIGKERDYAVEAMEEARTYMRIETTHARSAETRAEKLSFALAAEQAINKDLKIELDEALVAFADQKVISNYSREQGIKALAVLKLARPYVARIASRTSGPDVRDHLSKIDALIGKQD